MIYGYWNPVPVMMFAVDRLRPLVWIVLVGCENRLAAKSRGRSQLSIYDIFKPVFTMLTPSWRDAILGGFAVADHVSSRGAARLLYTGNGQTYNLYIFTISSPCTWRRRPSYL